MAKIVLKHYLIFVVGTLLCVSAMTYGCHPRSESSGGSEFEIIRRAADVLISGDKEFEILAKDLFEYMNNNAPAGNAQYYNPLLYNDNMLIDVRSSDDEMPVMYAVGHIPGAINIPWRSIAQWRNLKDFKREDPIIVYSSTGQTGAQIAGILNIMGYHAKNLKWGLTSWVLDEKIAPGRYEKIRDTVWTNSGSYRAVCPLSEPEREYPLPIVENTESEDEFTIIMAAANAYLKSGKPANMEAPYLHNLLYSELNANPGLPSGHWGDADNFAVPFFLDVRKEENYLKGHLCGTAHIFWKDLFKTENLKKLPPSGQILVVSETGHIGGLVTGLLNMLGYNAVNLKWGITSWSLALPGRDFTPNRYYKERDCIGTKAIVKGYKFAQPCPG